MGVIIAVANQKGGVGKTTTTANLGSGLALRGYRVLLVDMDPQANLTAAFGIERIVDGTIGDALMDRSIDPPILRVADIIGVEIDIIPADLKLASIETSLVSKIARDSRLRDQLSKVVSDYDFILIDTPPSLGLLTVNALVGADWVIIPTEARFFSMQGLEMLDESISEVLYLNPKLKILGIVLSKFDKRLREETSVSKFLREKWGPTVFETPVPVNSKILEASSAGVSVYAYKGSQKAAGVYDALVEEVVARA